jgi:hypothetical protein
LISTSTSSTSGSTATVAAGAGTDFEHDVALVHGVLGQQRDANLLRQLLATHLQRRALGGRHLAHLGVRGWIGDHGVDAGDLGCGRAPLLHRLDHRIELRQLARHLHVSVGADLTEQFGFDRRVSGKQDIKFGFGKGGHG